MLETSQNMNIKKLTFNIFYENTYIIWDETKECIIIDPGCYEDNEKLVLADFIESNNLIPRKIINTHCHIDHILGNKFVANKWNLELYIHKKEIPILENSMNVAQQYGFNNFEESPNPNYFIEDGDFISFGKSKLEVLFTPGHSPGHISLLCKQKKIIISGDVIFQNSIGRTDLPGGNYNQLIESIEKKILTLNSDTIIHCGHGPNTIIKKEIDNNPFLREN
tara:strand:+ start:8372 stop:9037 length:666 start_codon:yes stop_codon:yes gene_type:complete